MNKYDRYYMKAVESAVDAARGEACDSFCLGLALAFGFVVIMVVW